MMLLLHLVTAWICTIYVNAGIDSYVPQCYPPCPYDKYCREGECVCRRGINHFGKCVAACPSPKVYKACPSNCPRTCDDDPNKPIACSKECDLSRYCVCPDGYVERSKTDSTCVKKEECPLYCKPPSVTINCIPGCIGTCEHPEGKPGCRKDLCLFAISCGCPAGYVQKSDTDSTCVKLKDCSNTCPKPKIYLGCSTSCPITCENVDDPPTICTADCRPGVRCVCPKGYVERSSSDSTCVRKSDCPQYQCKSPKVYTPCATSCPDTCDNIDEGPRPCILRCRIGVNCICPKGYVEISSTDSTCVKKSACPCQLPKDSGPCEGFMPMFYFDSKSGQCKDFIYGGCQGNANRFESRKDCEASCSVCKLDKDPGPCEAAITRYFYNKKTKNCEKFIYGGCLGNANRFNTLSDCRKACGEACPKPKIYSECSTSCPITCDNVDDPPTICTADCRPGVRCVCPEGYVEKSSTDSTCVRKSECPQYQCKAPKVYEICPTSCPETCDTIGDTGPRPCILACRIGVNCVCPEGYVERSSTDSTCVKKSACPCELPKDSGPCEALMPMFYFNAEIGKCQRFNYGGCQGNANRFETRKKCEATCSICKLDKDTGPCKAALRRYYYNKNTGDCELFRYGGCRGNANRFKSLSVCRKVCADPCILMLCKDGYTCKNGKCVDSCYPKICKLGSYCRNGMCVKRCGSGYCGDNGICLYNKCLCLPPRSAEDCTIY